MASAQPPSPGGRPPSSPPPRQADAPPGGGGRTAPRTDQDGAAAAALARIEALDAALHAHLRFPGTPLRVGVETALGRIPFAGVLAYTAVGAFTLATAVRYEAGPRLVARMGANILAENTLRAVPLVGWWVAPAVTGGNRRNLQLLRKHVQARAAAEAGIQAARPGHGSAAALGLLWRLFLSATWPLRRAPLWFVAVSIVLAPLAVAGGAAVFLAWQALRWLGVL